MPRRNATASAVLSGSRCAASCGLFRAAAAAALLAPVLAAASTASAAPEDRERTLHRYEAPARAEVVGDVYRAPKHPGDTLADVAEREGVGVERLRAANPRTAAAEASQRALRIPARHVLPDAPREGLVIDVAGMRLFHYPEGTDAVEVFPISTGREGWPTPVAMKTEVAARLEEPAWYPPESIRDARSVGDGSGSLPRRVPPGPENPLGEHALRLEVDGYLVHGTNEPRSIGERASHGCVRMHPRDIEHLFERVEAGTPVRFVDQPFRIGRSAQGGIWVESHPSAPGGANPEVDRRLQRTLSDLSDKGVDINGARLFEAAHDPDGIAVRVSVDGEGADKR